MTGDKYRMTVNNRALFDALASGRLTWWGQYSNDDVPVQRGDTIVFGMTSAYGGERPRPLNMAVTDARDLTVSLPIGGSSERTGDVLIVRVLSLRPADPADAADEAGGSL